MIYNAMFLCGLFSWLHCRKGQCTRTDLKAPLVSARSATVYAGMNGADAAGQLRGGRPGGQRGTLMVLIRRDLRVKETAARIALKKAQTLQARLKNVAR